MKIEIVDNFLSSYNSDILIKTLNGKKMGPGCFQWAFMNDMNYESYVGNYYFNHVLVVNYEVVDPYWMPLFTPFLDKLKIALSNVYRLKVNLYTRTQRRVHHSSHKDYNPNEGFRTALYYVNTNNGVTIFDGKKTVKSIENRIALFDGSNKHHSTTPTDCNYRSTINIDYKL